MLQERRIMNGISRHHHHHHHRHHYSYPENLLRFNGDDNGYATITASLSSSNPAASPSFSSNSCSGANYIEHRVTKMDTVAGIAIKYGVEVADIRRMNGLVTDLQMFALETLRIPLPGRHPPSLIVSNGSTANGEQTPQPHPHDDMLYSLLSLKLKPSRRVSPAMSSLQGYYGLASPKNGRTLFFEDESHSRRSPSTDPGFSLHRKSRSLVSLENALIISVDKIAGEAGEGSDADKSIRRRQRCDNDPSLQTPEILMKDDNGGGFLGRTGKGLALRLKLGSPRQNSTLIADFINDVLVSVRKSSSTSNLQETENGFSMWPTSKFARPIFDGLLKSMTVRRKKAA